ncbi:MAG: hypothetical protein CVU46_15250 [Chloroflexi bacterium HGW-Chloroflexi-8]|nr:MAG: hypothetical protein CVV34_05630 [Methanomicrobiales archaeon HGW-Methanomicrobiales-5]PKN84087.1 MAG: hypothetical protein CVU46_15250 [Chloroflexi bacterium HGW-Chloroflexi-8]
MLRNDQVLNQMDERRKPTEMENKVKDPVCRRELLLRKASWSYRYLSRMYYFCTRRCLTTFDQYPERYSRRIVHKDSNR